MTTCSELRDAFVAALMGVTDAATNVFSPYDWPTAPTVYPWILVDWRTETKHSKGRNTPLFDVTTHIQVIARTKAVAQMDDAGSLVARVAVERLKQQIEANIINNTVLQTNPDGSQRVQQFKSVHSEMNTSSEGEMPIAEVVITFEVEFAQGPEDFYPITGDELQGIDITVQMPPGTIEPVVSINFPT